MPTKRFKLCRFAVFGVPLATAILALSACGSSGGSSSSSTGSSSTVDSGSASQAGDGSGSPAQTNPQLSLLAGNLQGGAGNADGTGHSASFYHPYNIAVGDKGTLYVLDAVNHAIRKVSPSGEVVTLTSINLSIPSGIAVDGAGNVYVTDESAIHKITPTGGMTTFAGQVTRSGHTDGPRAEASFRGPKGIAVDRTGNLYVTDSYNHTIRKITASGVVTTLAGTAGVSGHADGTGSTATFYYPRGITIDADGNLYVTETSALHFRYASSYHGVRKITPTGMVTTLAGSATTGHADGSGSTASFNDPAGITVDGAGNLYVADSNNHTIRKITPAGVVTTLAGSAGVAGFADGTGITASFNSPSGVTMDSSGNLFVADTFNNTIRKITPEGMVTTLAGTAEGIGSSDGAGQAASFDNPNGTAVDSAGNVYVADTLNNTVRKVTPAGLVSTLAGTAGVVGTSDGIGATASFAEPLHIAIDEIGNLYVTAKSGDSIRKITPAGAVSTPMATIGLGREVCGKATVNNFCSDAFRGIAADNAGNLYVLDIFTHVVAGLMGFPVESSTSSAVRKITPGGVVTTLAGSVDGMGSADGIGTAASFNDPQDIAVDSAGNVYVADTRNQTIRKITSAGVVTTLAGTAGVVGHADGIGPEASFNGPTGITIDSLGNLYVADSLNSLIRKVTPAGKVTTLIGTIGNSNFVAGDLPGAIPSPHSIAISNGTLYFTINNGVARLTGVN